MNSSNIQSYLKQAQEIFKSLDKEPTSLQELLHLIECHKNELHENISTEEFFKGEYAFHTGFYEKALKHYLESKGCEKYEFFCYRASAYVSKSQGLSEKAMNFIKKALEIFPEDRSSVMLYEELVKKREKEKTTALKIVDQTSTTAATSTADNYSDKPLSKVSKTTIQRLKAHELHVTDEEANALFLARFAEEDLFAANNPSVKAMINKMSCSPHRPLDQTNPYLPIVKQEDDVFKNLQKKCAAAYISKWKMRPSLPDHCLYSFQGWLNNSISISNHFETTFDEIALSLLYEDAHKSTGGFFIRWQGKGIVLNPGKNFLLHFHQAGLHVRDIDFVVSINEDADTHADIKKIYDLIYHFNQLESNDWHLVHYYLHSKIYQKLASTLKPHAKQERHLVHKLELFFDAPEGEKIDLVEGIRLHYFPTPLFFNQSDKVTSPLGIRLELKGNDRSNSVTLGYVSQANQAPFIHHHLGQCDLLLVGLGESHHLYPPFDNSFSSRCDAINAMITEFAPKLVLLTEFDSLEGDTRVEMTMQLREDSIKGVGSTVAPADVGLFVNLLSMHLKCSSMGEDIDFQHVHIIRSAGAFSRLKYLSPACIL